MSSSTTRPTRSRRSYATAAAANATGANATPRARRGTPRPRRSGRQTSPIDVDEDELRSQIADYLTDRGAPLANWGGPANNEDWSLPSDAPMREETPVPTLVTTPPTPRETTPAPAPAHVPAPVTARIGLNIGGTAPGVRPQFEIARALPVEVKDDLLPRALAQRASDMTTIFLLEMEVDILKRKLAGITEATNCPICLAPAYRPTTLQCGHSCCARCLKTWRDRGLPYRQQLDCPKCRQESWSTYRNFALEEVVQLAHAPDPQGDNYLQF